MEVLLNLLCVISGPVADALQPPWHIVTPSIEDAELGHRPRPDFGDHDGRGFRNPVALEQAEIVCMGDSQTYGRGVQREEAWPQQLASQ